jgi:hypothetical protein
MGAGVEAAEAGVVDCTASGGAAGTGVAGALAAGAGELPAAAAKGSLKEGSVWAGSGGGPLSAVRLMGGTWMLKGGTLCARSINATPAAAISARAATARVHPATRRVRLKVERVMAGAGFKVRPTVDFAWGSVNGEEELLIANVKLLIDQKPEE